MTNDITLIKADPSAKRKRRDVANKESDAIFQNILNASKLLEGRITWEELLDLDIPTFETLVNNEFANLEKSQEDLKNGVINAYNKNETPNMDSIFGIKGKK